MTATTTGTARKVALVVLAANAGWIGGWALIAPASFYRSFPGGGRSWISIDGPYNEHFVRDVGGLNLALLVLTIAALYLRQPTVTRLAGLTWLPFAVPHLIYHLAHVGDLHSTPDKIANTGGLALTAVLALALAIRPAPAATTTSGARKQRRWCRRRTTSAADRSRRCSPGAACGRRLLLRRPPDLRDQVQAARSG